MDDCEPSCGYHVGAAIELSGSLTVSSWEKLGCNLDFAAEQGTLKSGVHPIWKLVRSCLDQRCHEAVENGQAELEILQEERSEKAASKRENIGKESRVYTWTLQSLETVMRESDLPIVDFGITAAVVTAIALSAVAAGAAAASLTTSVPMAQALNIQLGLLPLKRLLMASCIVE
ncbi:hypothetical protein STEG23_014766 [Scotinomys teguina]